MTMMRSMFRRLRRFRDDEGGSVAIETLMMVPFLSWAMLSTLAYFDAYRAEAISQKAGLTIADMFSRETDYITPDYMTGARELLRFLTLAENNPDLRVTVVRYRASNDRYLRVWSKKKGGVSSLSWSEVKDLAPKLPELADGERIIVVETFTKYSQPYAVGLSDFTMDTFHVISPRFSTTLCWNPDENDPNDTDDDSRC